MTDHLESRSARLPSTVRLPLVIFLVLTAFYLLTMSGHPYSSDEETMYVVTRQIALAGDIVVEVEPGAPVAALRKGIENRYYSPYGIMPSIVALPLFYLGTLLEPSGGAAFEYATRFTVLATNSLVTATTAALLAAWALRLGAGRFTAVALALLYGLATFAWPYARTFFSEPLAALFLLIAVERADAARHHSPSSPDWPLLISGLAAGLLVSTRVASGIALPIIGLYVIWPRLAPIPAERPLSGIAGSTAGRVIQGMMHHPWIILRSSFIMGLWWLIGIAIGILPLISYNLLRSGELLSTGYGSEKKLFITSLSEGLYGLLLSPGKSVFLFALPILLALPGAYLLWRRRPGLVLVIWSLFGVHVLFYARWIAWSGGAWGPRFLLPTIALLILLIGPVIDATMAGGRSTEPQSRSPSRRIGWIATGILGVIGFLGSLGGVLVNFDTYLNMPVGEVRRVYEPLGSPLIVHWQILADRIGRYMAPSPHCALAAGFFAPEEASMFPRRSGAQATIACRLDHAAHLSLSLNDGRPADMPDSQLTFYLDDTIIAGHTARQPRTYHLLVPPGRPELRLVAVTWNPRQAGFSERDDNLGIVITAGQVHLLNGDSGRLIDRAIEPLPVRPKPRFAWYYEAHNQHLVDHWAWYLPRSELSPHAARVMAVGLCAMSVSLVVSAVILGRREYSSAG